MAKLEIKKSKFIGYIFNINSSNDVEEIIKKIKNENKKATHVCFAFRVLENGIVERAFDDKEPSGTAGKPILNVIQKKNLENTLIVIVRYFGGIKLGAGGLLRAYSKTASLTADENLM